MIFLTISLLIFTVGLVNLFCYKDEPYSLHKVVNLFFVFFYSVAPIVQYHNKVRLWGGNVLFTEADYENTSLVLLLILIFYNIIYSLLRALSIKKRSQKATPIFNNKPFKKSELLYFLLITVIVFIIQLYINQFNLLSLLFRGGEYSTSLKIDQSISLIIGTFVRPIPIIILSFIGVVGVREKSVKFLVWIISVLAILSVFPSSMPRFMVAAFYMPLLFIFCKRIMRKRNVFILMMVIGILIVFPFLNNFRNFSSESRVVLGLDYEMFSQGHFDAYSILLRVLKLDIITYGYQITGALLFFIPRQYWPTKPLGSGYTIAHLYNLDFDNISCPYFAEGYINWGWLGVVLFTIILSIFTVWADKKYWQGLSYTDSVNRIRYYLLIGLLFFMMRGDLLSTASFTVGILCSFLFVKKISKRV